MKFKPEDFKEMSDNPFLQELAVRAADAKLQEWLSEAKVVGYKGDGMWDELWELPPDTHLAQLVNIWSAQGPCNPCHERCPHRPEGM
jgi:hypothetical protein